MARNADYTRMLDTLKERGFRVTGPRRALLRLLSTSLLPISVQEMHAAVNPELADGEEEINLVTVYRFANLLVEQSLARRIEFGQGYYRYERAEPQDGPHHHHLVCEGCGKVEDFHGCDLAALTERLESETGFAVNRHQLELYGRCPDCQGKPTTTTVA